MPTLAGRKHHMFRRLVRGLSLAFVLAALAPLNFADTTVCGDVCNQTWTQTGSPYVVTCEVRVPEGCSLTIESGVEVRIEALSPSTQFEIEGTLSVLGTASERVVIQSDAASPSSSDWSGLWLMGDAVASLAHADVLHGQYGIYLTGSASVDLDSVTLSQNEQGLRVQGSGTPAVTAVDSAFTNNTQYGIYLYGAPNPDVSITKSSIHSNAGAYDFVTYGYLDPWNTIIDLRENWWGTTDAEAISARIIDHRYSTTRPFVDYCDYLDGPNGVPARDAHCPDLVTCGETQTWSLTDKPYYVVTDLWVCTGATLRLEPGVEVQIARTSSPLDFLVEGTLDVAGSEALPVAITSAESPPATGDWQGVHLYTGAVATFDHAEITYATRGINADSDAQVTLQDTTLTQNERGLYVSGWGPPSVSASDCSFTGNTQHGIYTSGSPDPDLSVTRSSIHSNGGAYDFVSYVYADSWNTVIPARENWWGTTDAEAISARILDHRFATNRPVIDYCHYLDGPDGVPARDTHCPDLVSCGETQVLNQIDKPYLIVSDLWVCPGGTLRVEAGVELRAAKTSNLLDFLVEGTLEVYGSPSAPVLMTSDESSPSTGDWLGPQLSWGSTSTIEHAQISYADKGIYATADAIVTLNNVVATTNEQALYVGGGGPPNVTVTDSSFTGNTLHGVYLYGAPNPNVSISGTSIHSNGGAYDFVTYGYIDPWHTVVTVRQNWWGTTDPEVISGRILDHRYSTTRPFVDYCGYLDGPGGVPARDVSCIDPVICGETVILQGDKPFQLVTDLWVCPGATLQIDEGVEVRSVKASPRSDFLVEGVLDILGAPDDPVVLTSDKSSPETGDWIGPLLWTNSSAHIENVEISYAEHGVRAAENSQATILGLKATRNYDGILVQGSNAPIVRAAGCTLTENERSGFYVYGSPDPDVSVTRSSIHSNLGAYDVATYGFFDPANSVVWALDNWWGSTDTDDIDERIFDRKDSLTRPRVAYNAFGSACEPSIASDGDSDGWPDFDDNCPEDRNASQIDEDGDGMGNACDDEPLLAPVEACDGHNDLLDGYSDLDGDGWGDPCDHQPLRTEAHPGASELCDARDTDGDADFGTDELMDRDADQGLACGDCDDDVADLHACACEYCLNTLDDDCDGQVDGDDADCFPHPTCIQLADGAEITLTISAGACGGATIAGPYDVVQGHVGSLGFNGGSVDLGQLTCVESSLNWDRVTEYSPRPNPSCDELATLFFLAAHGGTNDYGSASSGEPRDVMDPDPACP